MKIISFKNILSKYLFLSLVEIFSLLTKSAIFGLATLTRRPATLLKMLFHVNVFLGNLQNVQNNYLEGKIELICCHFSVCLDDMFC